MRKKYLNYQSKQKVKDYRTKAREIFLNKQYIPVKKTTWI